MNQTRNWYAFNSMDADIDSQIFYLTKEEARNFAREHEAECYEVDDDKLTLCIYDPYNCFSKEELSLLNELD